jgi:hypothetical protein
LVIAGIHLFRVALSLDPQGCNNIPVASGDLHIPQRDLGISMGSWVAVEPSGMGLPSRIETPKPFWAEPSYRASVSGALSIIASRGIPKSSRDITSSSKQLWVEYLISLDPDNKRIKSIPTTMKKDTAPPTVTSHYF